MDWKSFLKEWENEMLNLYREIDSIDNKGDDEPILKRGTLMFPPATSEQIESAESRLGAVLPDSYKGFLKTTNGWIQLAMDAGDAKILSTDEADWLKKRDPMWIEAWEGLEEGEYSKEEYLQYGENLNSLLVPQKYLEDALAISETVDTAIYLMNPHVLSSENEWEAWWLSSAGGAFRYPSFEEMMVAERQRTKRAALDAMNFVKRMKGQRK